MRLRACDLRSMVLDLGGVCQIPFSSYLVFARSWTTRQPSESRERILTGPVIRGCRPGPGLFPGSGLLFRVRRFPARNLLSVASVTRHEPLQRSPEPGKTREKRKNSNKEDLGCPVFSGVANSLEAVVENTCLDLRPSHEGLRPFF